MRVGLTYGHPVIYWLCLQCDIFEKVKAVICFSMKSSMLIVLEFPFVVFVM